ncbi:glutaminase A [Streptomyces chartreusis]|uniref:glutaminase A n=1 Tax=Streptomyces chartreusis TaxID=1969 RepID=UPI002E188705|nr:glutaminase A [Streptomyces chartreusis]
MFDEMSANGTREVTWGAMAARLVAAGIAQDDPRFGALAGQISSSGVLTRDRFVSLAMTTGDLVEKIVNRKLVVPGFPGLAAAIDVLYEELKSDTRGKVADYIPELGKVDPGLFAIAVCTMDGQRHRVGDWAHRFCLQSVSKTVNYAMALETHDTETVHAHVGREPSGVSFNELVLDRWGRPHNPMINAGAIMTTSMVHASLPTAQRRDRIMETWSLLAGGKTVGFNDAVYQSERTTADRNFALGYYMREKKAFPLHTDLLQTLDLYFQCCSLELDTDALAVVAGAFANGGVCPLTDTKVLFPATVQHCLSLMASCGMYDFSGEFAFTVGLPAKSGVSGALMIVVPQVMGIAVFSPRLDEHGNSVRGIELCRKLVETYNVHPCDADVRHTGKRLIGHTDL